MISLLRHLLQALTLTTLLHLLYIYTIDTPKPIYYCPLHLQDLPYWNENCYWSSSYAEAREKFVALGNLLREQIVDEKRGLGVASVKSISYDVSDGMIEKYGNYADYLAASRSIDAAELQSIPPGRDTIDALLVTLCVPENKEGIDIIHSSGVHGVEGYSGSAIQIRYLRELVLHQQKQNVTQTIPDASANFELRKVLLLHAINPHGMRHHRRTNANNVDLNRNALSEEEWEFVRKRDPNFAGYVDLDSTLNPFFPSSDGEVFSWADEARSKGFEGDVAALKRRDDRARMTTERDAVPAERRSDFPDMSTSRDIREWIDQSLEIVRLVPLLIKAIASKGYASTKRAFVSSQYLKPSGSQYGGGNHDNHEDAWENEVWAVKHAVEEFAGFGATNGDADAKGKNRVFWIDVHTGLGKYAEYSLLSAGSRKVKTPEWAQKLTAHLGDTLNTEESDNASVSLGYDATLGFINGPALCPPPRCFAQTQEFGTRPGVMVGLSMVLENKGFQGTTREFGFSTSWAFCPRRLSWRRRVLRGGMEMLRGALDF